MPWTSMLITIRKLFLIIELSETQAMCSYLHLFNKVAVDFCAFGGDDEIII